MVPLLFVLHPQLQSAWEAASNAHDPQGVLAGRLRKVVGAPNCKTTAANASAALSNCSICACVISLIIRCFIGHTIFLRSER